MILSGVFQRMLYVSGKLPYCCSVLFRWYCMLTFDQSFFVAEICSRCRLWSVENAGAPFIPSFVAYVCFLCRPSNCPWGFWNLSIVPVTGWLICLNLKYLVWLDFCYYSLVSFPDLLFVHSPFARLCCTVKQIIRYACCLPPTLYW
jgi:hypothetical protein